MGMGATRGDDGLAALRRQQRLVFRCAMEFLFDEAARLARRHDGDVVRGAILLAVIQASRGGATEKPAARAVSVRALSASLLVPYETTRRKVGELEALGLCRRIEDAGVVAAPAAIESEQRRLDNEGAWRSLRRTIVDLRALGFDLRQAQVGQAAARAEAPPTEAVASLAADFILRVIEAAARIHGSMVDALLAGAMLVGNAQLITRDPELAWRYAGAETPPPDELRRPVTITEIAARLDVGYEILRRRANRFVRLGWAARVRGGYLFSVDRLQAPEVLQSGLLSSQNFLQLLRSVSRLGVDLETVEA